MDFSFWFAFGTAVCVIVGTMATKSIIQEKSFFFRLKIIALYQLLKSGTSIGANVCEALAGESTRDFLHKMSIASKEARETHFWLMLLQGSQLIKKDFSQEIKLAEELIRIVTAIVNTTASKRQ